MALHRWSSRVLPSALIVSALLLAPGAGLALGAPKRPPVPAFWDLWPVWSAVFDPLPLGPPAFDSTAAYIGLRDGRLAGVSLLTGDIMWSTNQGLTSPPSARDGLLFAITTDTLLSLDSFNGDVRWQHPLGSASVVAPVIGPTWIAVITATSELIVLSQSDGGVIWRKALPAPAKALPVGDADRIIVGLTNGQAMAFSAKDGAAQWTRKVGGELLVLTLDRDRVFVGTSDNFLCALVADSGKEKWRWRTGADVVGTVALDNKRVYFASLDNSLVALGRGGGDMKWEQRLPSRPVGGPALVGDTLVLVTVAGDLKTFSTDRGTPIGTRALAGRPLSQPYVVPWTGPVPPKAIILTAGGQLLAIGPLVEWPLEPLDPLILSVVLPLEILDSVEPPLVPMVYPPGRLLMPETLPPAVIKTSQTTRP